jgi:Leucine Rich repeat
MRYRLRTLLQFRLGTLLLAVTVFGIWLGVQVNRANRQKRAIAEIAAARGVIHFDYQRDAKGQRIPDAEPGGPKWLRKLIGDDYFRKVITVSFATEFYGRRKQLGLSKVDDDGLRCFESLPDVETIELGHNRAVTDDGLVHLRNLKKLQVLYLYDCNITGTGLKHFVRLPNLHVLDIRWTPITSDGIATIGKLQNLTVVALPETTSDDDLAALKALANLKELRLENTGISDKGLIHLESLSGLQELILPEPISDQGMKQLQVALPKCRIFKSRKLLLE